MKVSDFFKKHSKDGKRAPVIYHEGEAVLWIEKHDLGLTVIDYITSIRELGFRDDSNRNVDTVCNEWMKRWEML